MKLRLLSYLLFAITVALGLTGCAMVWGDGSTSATLAVTAAFLIGWRLFVVVNRRRGRWSTGADVFTWFVAMVACAAGLGMVMAYDGSRPMAGALLTGAVVSVIGLGRAVYR